MPWDDRFEALLRAALPYLSPDEPLPPDAELVDLGIDSMAAVELLSTVEQTYDVRFPDDSLHRETFRTAGTLWAVLSRLFSQEPTP
ncbi:acyl carrier protein [Streptomyces natalensis]|uniref:Phosphopantetheine-binding protein n=1 Tax=Streptomyces natalensis ATCC 27448 TaxID=1240678 RepID=A0A0D7CP87_9ACTN|nr:acyl carrier protein [Streptomyces natalensis]KIZ18069.1 phosphopantetheine-binding protein [Streptomyces natalensis ATCC 27448]